MSETDSSQHQQLSTPYNRALDAANHRNEYTPHAVPSEKVIHKFFLDVREIPYDLPRQLLHSGQNTEIPARSLEGTSYLPQCLREYGISEQEWLQFRYKILSCIKKIKTAENARIILLLTGLLGFILVLPFSSTYRYGEDAGESRYVTSKWGNILVNATLGFVTLAFFGGIVGVNFFVFLVGRHIKWICRDSKLASGAVLVRVCQYVLIDGRPSKNHLCWIEACVPASYPVV